MSEIPRANVIDIAVDTIKAAIIIVFSNIWLTSDFFSVQQRLQQVNGRLLSAGLLHVFNKYISRIISTIRIILMFYFVRRGDTRSRKTNVCIKRETMCLYVSLKSEMLIKSYME